MPKKRGLTIGKSRGFLYGLARLLGGASAVGKDAGGVTRRVARRGAGKATSRFLRRLFT